MRLALSWELSAGFDGYGLRPMPDVFATHEIPSMADFFQDTPWGRVPPHRLTTMTKVRPSGYKGGLLGGSKLQALAAKRKQKQETAPEADAAKTEKAVELLDRLCVTGESRPLLRAGGSNSTKLTAKYPSRKRTPPPEERPVQEEGPNANSKAEQPTIEFPDLRAQPSMFGATLCGLAKPTMEPTIEHPSTFSLPYARSGTFSKANPFSGPSPDDVVQQAQARAGKRG